MDGDLRGAHRARSPPNLYSSTDSCGPPPSTRTDDPNLTYRQPSGQRKATDESFSKVLSAPKQRKATDESFSKVLSKVLSSKDSPNTTTRRLSRCAADSADRQAARQSQNDHFTRVSNEQTREQQMPIKERASRFSLLISTISSQRQNRRRTRRMRRLLRCSLQTPQTADGDYTGGTIPETPWAPGGRQVASQKSPTGAHPLRPYPVQVQ